MQQGSHVVTGSPEWRERSPGGEKLIAEEEATSEPPSIIRTYDELRRAPWPEFFSCPQSPPSYTVLCLPTLLIWNTQLLHDTNSDAC